MAENERRMIALTAAGLGAGALAARWLRPGSEADFTGKVAFVTGGSRGLGFILARELLGEGCRVAICARDAAELETARVELAKYGDVYAEQCDISDRQDVERTIAAVTGHYGAVDILFNNAGVIQVGPLSAMTIADFEEAMDSMFWGVLYPTLAVLPQMRQRQSGWIVNITSIGGKISAPHLLPYSSAKFAAVGLSEGLRAELARENISVTTIAPGLMRTGSHLNAFFKGDAEKEFSWFSLGASLPFISMDAERAARQIIQSARKGEAERILSLPAAFAARIHGLFPGTTSNVLGLVNTVLPGTGSSITGRVPGAIAENRLGSKLLDSLTEFGRSAARRFNE
jgi:NAD(P)-dependent dehydrogenase (short-subunit alcohol dehydrogenase family)